MRARILALLLVVAMGLLAGCSDPTAGPGSAATPSLTLTPTPTVNAFEVLTPEELLTKSRDALLAASSFRARVSATVGPITAVTDVVYVGGNAKGSTSALGQVNEFVRIGKDLYIKAGDSYWSGIVRLQQIQLVSGKWVKVAATNPVHASIVPSIEGSLTSSVAVTKVGTTTVDGKPAFTLKGSDGSTIDIASDGVPYPLRIEGFMSTPDGDISAVVEFSEFGTVVATFEVPAGEIIDLTG